MTFADGENVGPYRIISKLGQGGMATVYKAYHPALDRHVAIKVMHEAFKDDEGFLARFQREAQIVARMEHPNIVPIHDFNQHEGSPYLVMKFVEGQTLKARIAANHPTLKEVLYLLDGVGEALTYAHGQGILHRDIKPSNVILDKAGISYLTDFGLARIASAGESTLSQDMMLGTPQYISPEQARGDRNLDEGTDIYSLGVMLYELVVGQVPFNADTPYAIVHDHIFSPLPVPSAVNPDVPQAVEMVLLKALAKGRADRYATVADLVAAFKWAVETDGMTEISPSVAAPVHQGISPAAEATDAEVVEGPVAETPLPQPSPETVTQHPTPAPPEPVFQPGIPPVVDPLATPPAMSAYAARQNRYGGLWVLGGCMTLIFLCVISVVGISAAIGNDVPGSGPVPTLEMVMQELPSLADFGVEAGDPPFDPDTLQRLIEEAEEQVIDNRHDPVAQFNLALLTLMADPTMTDSPAFESFIDLADSDPLLLLAAMIKLDEFGFPLHASWLGLYAMELYPDHAAVREQAGRQIWAAAGDASTRQALNTYSSVFDQFDSTLATVMKARAQIAAGRLTLARVQVNLALGSDQGSMAEVHLVNGLLYAEQGDPENALNELQYVETLADTPAWVVETAGQLIQDYALREQAPPPDQASVSGLAAIEIPDDRASRLSMLESARAAADDAPDDPTSQFKAGLLTMLVSPDLQNPMLPMRPFLETSGEDPVMLVDGIQVLIDHELDTPAAWLSVHALASYPDDAAVRETTGSYLWEFTAEVNEEDVPLIEELSQSYQDPPLLRVVYALALIGAGESDPDYYDEARRQIDAALEAAPGLPEAHLARALLLITTGEDPQDALESLAAATAAPDAPDWVKREADILDDQLNTGD
jgi:serine/threonine-protein kinase